MTPTDPSLRRPIIMQPYQQILARSRLLNTPRAHDRATCLRRSRFADYIKAGNDNGSTLIGLRAFRIRTF
jgi:hypothetical protein